MDNPTPNPASPSPQSVPPATPPTPATPPSPEKPAKPAAPPSAKPAAPAAPAAAASEPARPVFVPLDAALHAEWDEFVVRCPRGSAFQTTWWYRAWGFEPRVQVLRDEKGAITAGICYALGRRFGTTAIVRPPCTAGNGVVFSPSRGEGRYKELTHAKQMNLLAIHSLPQVGFYDLVLRPADNDLMPFLWNGFDTYVGYTYVIPAADKDTWMDGASKTSRKEMRRAMREVTEKGYQIRENPSAEEILPLVKDTVAAKDFRFEGLDEKFGHWWQAIRDHGVGCGYLLCDKEGVPMAADVMVWDTHTAYSVVGGIRADLRKDSRVGTILLQRMIADAHGRGLNFDFEGSVQPGVERFMRSFGGELRPMCRVLKIRAPHTYLAWQIHRYLTRHRKPWVWVD